MFQIKRTMQSPTLTPTLLLPPRANQTEFTDARQLEQQALNASEKRCTCTYANSWFRRNDLAAMIETLEIKVSDRL